MPKIYTANTDTNISGNDKLLGTDSAPGALNATKNYTIDSIKTFVLDGLNAVSNLTISVAGQSDVVSDGTLTLVAGDNVTLTTNASTDTITFNATQPTFSAGDGLNLVGNEFSVNSNIAKLIPSQTFLGSNTFSQTIIGNINGNAETVTNGMYTNNAQSISGYKTFEPGISSADYSFTQSFGKVAEKKLVLTPGDVQALTSGVFELVQAPGNGKIIIPISIAVYLQYGTTAYALDQPVYIGLNGVVDQNPNNHFSVIRTALINSTMDAYEYLPQESFIGSSHVKLAQNEALMAYLPGGASPGTGDSNLKISILYRVLDFN